MDEKLLHHHVEPHSQIHRPGRLNPAALNCLSVEERLAAIQSCQGQEKLNLLIEAIDGPDLLKRLPLQEVYMLLRQVGVEDVPELFEMCSSEQLCGFLDLAGWQMGELQQKAVLDWLALLFEAGEPKVLQVAREMEFELFCLMLQKCLLVVGGPEDFEDDDARVEALSRDGGYVIEYRDELSAKLVGGLLDILLRFDMPLYLRLMEGVRRELPAELEESVARFREGRLLDNGFPEASEAIALFGWSDPKRFDPKQHLKSAEFEFPVGLEAPSYLLQVQPAADLLIEVMSRGMTSEAAWELAYLLNKLMQANQVDIGDPAAVEETLDQLYSTLNLALQEQSDGDFERAVALWNGIYFQALFQHGYNLTLVLKQQANDLLRTVVGPFFSSDCREFLETLSGRHPLFFRALDQLDQAGNRWFRSLKDLRLAETWLGRLELQRRLFEDYFPFDLPRMENDQPVSVTLAQLYHTALANQLLGGDFFPLPLTEEALHRFHRLVSSSGKLKDSIRVAAHNRLEIYEKGAGQFAEWALAELEEGFCALDIDQLDGRYLPLLVESMG